MKLFIAKIYVDSQKSIYKQLRNVLRGQWIFINGMTGRVVNITDGKVVISFNKTNDVPYAVYR